MTDATGASTPTATSSPAAVHAQKVMGMHKMGIGMLGGDYRPIRKFRWTFSVLGDDGKEQVKERFCKVQSRPQLEVEEVEVKKPDQEVEENELNFLSAKTWIPGKNNWTPITLLFGVDGTEKGLKENEDLYGWLGTVYGFDAGQGQVAAPLKRKVVLKLYDGCGVVMETWTLHGAFPKGVKFDGPYDSDEYVGVELRLKYDGCVFDDTWARGLREGKDMPKPTSRIDPDVPIGPDAKPKLEFPWPAPPVGPYTAANPYPGSTAPSPGCTEGAAETPKA